MLQNSAPVSASPLGRDDILKERRNAVGSKYMMCINSNVCHNGYRGSNCKYYHGPICNENPNVCECINVHYCIDGIKCENKKTCGNIHEPDSKYLESIFQSKDNTKHSVLKILCKLQDELRSTQEELKNSKRELETQSV